MLAEVAAVNVSIDVVAVGITDNEDAADGVALGDEDAVDGAAVEVVDGLAPVPRGTIWRRKSLSISIAANTDAMNMKESHAEASRRSMMTELCADVDVRKGGTDIFGGKIVDYKRTPKQNN